MKTLLLVALLAIFAVFASAGRSYSRTPSSLRIRSKMLGVLERDNPSSAESSPATSSSSKRLKAAPKSIFEKDNTNGVTNREAIWPKKVTRVGNFQMIEYLSPSTLLAQYRTFFNECIDAPSLVAGEESEARSSGTSLVDYMRGKILYCAGVASSKLSADSFVQ